MTWSVIGTLLTIGATLGALATYVVMRCAMWRAVDEVARQRTAVAAQARILAAMHDETDE